MELWDNVGVMLRIEAQSNGKGKQGIEAGGLSDA